MVCYIEVIKIGSVVVTHISLLKIILMALVASAASSKLGGRKAIAHCAKTLSETHSIESINNFHYSPVHVVAIMLFLGSSMIVPYVHRLILLGCSVTFM